MSKTPILIAGPTASGKSALALHLAGSVGGAIINTDSMQVYSGLEVLTAAPSAEERAAAPHFLYGALDPSERCSAGRWARMAEEALAHVQGQGLTPIFVGGTGLYFRSLTDGLSAIPPVPPEIRARAEDLLKTQGIEGLLAQVVARDPETAGALRATDTQRIQRAWEVLESTGRGLAAWQAEAGAPVLSGPCVRIALEPPRDWLYARCDGRFEQMLAQGALDEVAALIKRGLDPSLPAMKALGVRELADHLAGRIILAEASERAKMLTRRYAKRQMTWMRNQMTDWPRLDPSRDDAFMQGDTLVDAASRDREKYL